MSFVKRLAGALPTAALGITLLLAWSYLLSDLGIACPCLDGTLVMKALLQLPGVAGALLWTLLLLIAWAGGSSPRLLSALLAAVPSALLASLMIGTPLPLAAVTLVLALSWLRGDAQRLFLALLAGVCLVEALVIAFLLSWAAGKPLPLSFAWPLHYSLYCFLAPAMPPLVALALLSPLLHPVLRWTSFPHPPSFVRGRGALALSIGTCLLLWLVLYASSLNPGVKLVGVDSITRYYPHALVLLREGTAAVLRVGYDRPLYYLLLLGLARELGPFGAVKILPLLSLVLYAAACYAAAKELWGERIAGFAALLAPLSYTTTAGLFGGLFNNWFSLSLTLLAVAALARWERTGRFYWALLYLLALALSAAAHVYMGAVAFAVLTLFLLTRVVSGPRRSGAAALAIAQLALLVVGLNAFDTLLEGVGGRPASRILRSLTSVWQRATTRRPIFSAAWWEDFSFAVFNYAATAALDPTVWLLTAIAVSGLGPRGPGGSLLTCWLAVTAALSFTAPREYIFRAFFDFPYPLAEAVAVARLVDVIQRRRGARLAALWLASIVLFKLAYVLTFVCGLTVGGQLLSWEGAGTA